MNSSDADEGFRLPDAEAEAPGAADGARASPRPVSVIHPRTTESTPLSRRRTIIPFLYARARHTRRTRTPLLLTRAVRLSLFTTSARGAAGMLEGIWREKKAGDGIESPGFCDGRRRGTRQQRGDSSFLGNAFFLLVMVTAFDLASPTHPSIAFAAAKLNWCNCAVNHTARR